MTDVERTCANCGNVQASGDFCEKCGTRMPAAPQAAAAGAAAAAYQAARPAAPPQTSPAPTAPQAPVTPPPAPAPTGYAPQPAYTPQPSYAPRPGYGEQPGYGMPADQSGYAGGDEPYRRHSSSGWGRLFDFSFQGFVTPATLKVTYLIILGLIGLYVLFNIIYVAMLGNRFTVIAFFISLFVAGLWFFATRVLFELMATIMRKGDKKD